ncbi:hypothetical protein [Nostoc sp. MG11]|nr:hypothetical protein [Nostoc sp. MG11]
MHLDRKSFPNAHTQGLAVTELKPRDPKAVQELEARIFENVAMLLKLG